MRPIAWVLGSGPPFLLAIAVIAGLVFLPARLVASANIGVIDHPCPPPTGFSRAVAASTRLAPIDAHLRLRAKLNADGELVGRTFTLSTAAGPRSLVLAAESFASSAVSNVVVYGQSTADAGSTVSAIDLQTGCQFELHRSTDIVRGALIDPSLRNLYLHTVSPDRADQGVHRVDLASGGLTAVVPPVGAAPEFGPTFATLLRWSIDDDAIAVQSCGIAHCRTRVLQLPTAAIETYADGGQGELVGLDSRSVFTFSDCEDRPCSLVAIERHSGRRSAIAIDAVGASISRDARGVLLTVTTPAGSKEIRP
jgi:hypothetical protein